MRRKHKTTKVEKHRGNPHGTSEPHLKHQRRETSNDNLSQSGGRIGVNEGPRSKQ